MKSKSGLEHSPGSGPGVLQDGDPQKENLENLINNIAEK